MFEQLRRAVGDLEAVSRALDPSCLDGRGASALVEVAARGERICSAMKALGARRVEETNAWREGGHRSVAHWVAMFGPVLDCAAVLNAPINVFVLCGTTLIFTPGCNFWYWLTMLVIHLSMPGMSLSPQNQ